MRRLGPGRPLAACGLVLSVAVLFVASEGRARQERASAPANAEGRHSGQYEISAHVIFLGNLADVGSMTIESALQRNEGRLEKTLRLAGSSYPEQAKKNRDFSGEFNLLKRYPLRPDDPVESSSSGFLKRNQKVRSERMTFFPDHAAVVRDDGPETRIEGSYGCILSPLEYLMDHDIKVGEVIDIPFILSGVPRIFRMEVEDLTTLSPFKAPAYEISLYAIEKLAGPDRAPRDVWRKKGNLRIWFCKEGPFRNSMLRMRIKFRWYLWLRFDLQKSVTE